MDNIPSQPSPESLIDKVTDRESFMRFVTALIVDREQAEELERREPKRYQLGGALNWQNGTISSFLSGAVARMEDASDGSNREQPTWRDFAEFLYCGKIYE